MSYTTTQLAVAVLRKLRVIDATETSSDVETAVLTHVTDTYRAKWEEITAHGQELTYWAYDTIPNPVFLTLVDLIANEVRDSFGQPMTAAEKESEERVILSRLRRHVQVQSSGRPTGALYF
jgi:predicted aminopeptidase